MTKQTQSRRTPVESSADCRSFGAQRTLTCAFAIFECKPRSLAGIHTEAQEKKYETKPIPHNQQGINGLERVF